MHELLPPQAEFLCSHCGYDRSGAPDSDCCPECGAPATRARWIVRGQKVRSPLMPAGIFAVVMLLVFHHLYSIPPEMFLPLQAVTLVFMIWMLRRPYRAILCAAPDGLSLRWGFGPAILMPAESIRSVRFFVAPGLRLQRTGRTEPTRWMLEIVGTPGANLVAGPVQPSAGPRTWSARFVGFFRPWGLPPALVVNGSRDEVMQLERAISTVIGDDPTRHPVVPSETPS